jgi:hypothetical protein
MEKPPLERIKMKALRFLTADRSPPGATLFDRRLHKLKSSLAWRTRFLSDASITVRQDDSSYLQIPSKIDSIEKQ